MRHGIQALAIPVHASRLMSVNMRSNVKIRNHHAQCAKKDTERNQLNKENAAIVVKNWSVRLMEKLMRLVRKCHFLLPVKIVFVF
jgi:hypothetical protein